MNKKLPQLQRPNVRLYFLLLIAFAVSTFFGGGYSRLLAGIQGIVIILAALYLIYATKRRTAKLLNYLESISDSMDLTVRDTPLPVLIYNSETGEIIWSNERFLAITGLQEPFFEKNVASIIPGHSWDWLLEGKHECEEPVAIGDKFYHVFGSVVLSDRDYLAMTYWIDITEYSKIKKEYEQTRLVFILLQIDNYDELFRGIGAKEKSAILSDIDDKINAWITDREIYLCRFDRDRYFLLLEEKNLGEIIADNFSILDEMRSCVGSLGIAATASIGIGKDGASPIENYRHASLGLEMALSRGGNQAAIRNRHGFEFFGGRPQAIERKTKVRARVMASAFGELLTDASTIFVMSHKTADYDSLGAAVGVCCIARSKNKQARIVIDMKTCIAGNIVEKIMARPEYKDVFITPQEAMLAADKKALLVIVDTSRQDKVESKSLLLSCARIAVIDHHRRTEDYIDNAVLSFNEPYASSASELVAEMMQYLVDIDEIMKCEAEAMLAGIVLDTKNFAVNTGSGTFDVAAYLKRAGADATSVKKLLQSDIKITTARYDLIRLAELYKGDIALAVSQSEHCRVSIAQAADELLNISGVNASFVVAKDGDTVYASGRSIGDVNVQVVLEKLGGGGSQATAGLQVQGKSVDDIAADLKKAIDKHVGRR